MTNLAPIKYDNKLILTTKQTADIYKVEPIVIQQNFNNNKEFYKEGRDYYLLKGAELKAFKNDLENFEVAKTVNKLYLWTEYGTVLHAKRTT